MIRKVVAPMGILCALATAAYLFQGWRRSRSSTGRLVSLRSRLLTGSRSGPDTF